MKCPAYHPGKVAQIQHDIRISLTGILWAINYLGKNTSLTVQQEAIIEMIHEGAERLLALDQKLPTILNHKKKETEIVCVHTLKKGIVDDGYTS